MVGRVGTTVVAGVLAVLLLALPAAAQDAGEVADDLARTGAHVAPGVDADRGALAEAARAASSGGDLVGLVVLGAVPSAGTDLFAEDVLDAWGATATVAVVTDEDVFAVSDVYDDAAVDAAIDEAVDRIAADPVDGLAGFAEALTGRDVPVGEDAAVGDTPAPAEGGGGFPWGLVVLLALVGGVVLLVVRANRAGTRRRADALTAARAEIAEQVTALGEQVFDLEAEVTLADDERVVERYEQATATFQQVRDALPAAGDHVALEELAGRVDHARWQLEAVRATLEGREVPPAPTPETPAACFFDPTHRAASDDATVTTPAGSAEVRVCADCAARLRAGEAPPTRQVDVGGHRVPAPRAPRSSGGRGLDWLAGAAEVLVRGASRGATVDMGRATSRRRTTRSRGGTGVSVPTLRLPGRSAGSSSRTRSSGGARTSAEGSRGRGGRRLGGASSRTSRSSRGRGGRRL